MDSKTLGFFERHNDRLCIICIVSRMHTLQYAHVTHAYVAATIRPLDRFRPPIAPPRPPCRVTTLIAASAFRRNTNNRFALPLSHSTVSVSISLHPSLHRFFRPSVLASGPLGQQPTLFVRYCTVYELHIDHATRTHTNCLPTYDNTLSCCCIQYCYPLCV